MNDLGVGRWIERRTRIDPERPALIWGETSLTYAQMAERIRRLAHALRALGVERGDRVGWLGPNHPAFLEAFFASALLGAAVAPVNHRLDRSAIVRILDDAEPTVVLVEESAADLVPSTAPAHRVIVGDPLLGDRYEDLVASAYDDPVHEPTGAEELCFLPYTSGTTGAPKGVMLTHANVTWNVVNFLSYTDVRSHDVTIAIAPFFRVGGTGVNVLPVLFCGGAVVVPRVTDADEILRLVEEHRVTIGFGNPDTLDALTHSDRWPTADLSSTRLFVTGGAPVPVRLLHAFLERDVTFVQGYGLSEAAPLVLLLDEANALPRAGSAGKPPLLVDARIVRPDGARCAVGETGELLVRGPNVMAGYWRHPDATKAAIDVDGWLHTGDAARTDDDGFYWIVDRLADAYESPTGRIVYPGDVEHVLAQHPAVEDVGVVGPPHPERGRGWAFVVLVQGAEPSEQDLLSYCAERLGPDQVPRSVTFVARLPRNSVGKLLRLTLRDQA